MGTPVFGSGLSLVRRRRKLMARVMLLAAANKLAKARPAGQD